MDLGQDIENIGAEGERATPAIAMPTRPTRPSRPTRPASDRRVLKPLVLDTPVVEDANVVADAPKPSARPVRPERRVLDGVEDAPRPARRARVLEPDQISASRKMPDSPPSAIARDVVMGEEDGSTSKIGGVMQAFAQIGSRLKKSKTEEDETADAVEPELVEEDTSKLLAPAGIVSKIKSRFQKTDDAPESEEVSFDQDDEELAKPSRVSVLAKSMEIDELALDEDAFEPMVRPSAASSAGIVARLDTTAMGIAAGIGVSCVALILASSILG